MSISPADLPSTGIAKVDDVLKKASAKLREIINVLNETSATKTKVLTNIVVSGAGSVIPHGLGRAPQGYRVIYSDYGGGSGTSGIASFRPPDTKNLYLIAGSGHRVSLEVF